MIKPKLTISIPLFPGVSVKAGEVEIPLPRLLTALRPLAGFARPDAWATTIHFALRYILADMHTDGDCRGGWGKSYTERYRSRTYPMGLPSDASRQPDSPSGTAMVVEGLYDLLQIPALVDSEMQELIGICLQETTKYFVARFDPVSGATGVMTQLAGGDVATAYNLRHSAMALKVWRATPGQHDRLGHCCEYLVRSSDALQLEAERALTIAAVLSGLAWVGRTEALRRGIPGAHRIPYLIRKADNALVANWSDVCRGWFDGKDRGATAVWYSAFVLKELSGLDAELTPDLRNRSSMALEMLIECLHELSAGQLGMPYRLGGPPDLGMSCLLFEVLAKRLDGHRSAGRLRRLCEFVTSFCERAASSQPSSADSIYLEDTYPWTIGSVFSGIRTIIGPQVGPKV